MGGAGSFARSRARGRGRSAARPRAAAAGGGGGGGGGIRLARWKQGAHLLKLRLGSWRTLPLDSGSPSCLDIFRSRYSLSPAVDRPQSIP